MKNRLYTVLAWLQLVVSVLFASAIVWGYVMYQASLGQFVQSAAASIGAVSNVVVRVAETIEAQRELLDQTRQMLVVIRTHINEIRSVAQSQAKSVPQYAEGMRAASAAASRLARTLQSIGEGLSFLAPTGIRMDHLKPIVIMSRPLDAQAQALMANAQDIKSVSESLALISVAISRDGQAIGAAVIANSEQALKVVSEAEKTLGQLKAQDLPKAIEDLRTTSENLRKISVQVDIVGNVGLVLLIVGLLLAVWCFLNSVGALMLAKSQAFALSSRQSPLAVSKPDES